MPTLLRATALALLATVLSAGPVTAQPTDEAPVVWGVVPAGENGRGAFTYTLDPGAEITDAVSVVNYTEKILTLRVYASDAVRSTDGGFDLLPSAGKPSDVGAWTRVEAGTVTVSPRSRVDVPFTVTVPANATPGDHAGGIVASLLANGEDGVAVDRRVGARIYARVTGTVNPSLTVVDLRATFDGSPLGVPGDVRLDYVVRNDGNLRLAGRPSVRVTGLFGWGERVVTGERLTELKPGDSIRANTTVPGTWQLGWLTAEVTVTLEASGGQELTPPPAPAAGSATLWAVPWLPLVVLALLVAAAVWWWHRRRGRRRERPSPKAAHSPARASARRADSPVATP